MFTRLLGGVAAGLLMMPAVALAQLDEDTYQRRPFYTYDLYDALDGYDYGRAAGRGPGGSGFYGGTDYLNYYGGDYYHDPDLYGDAVDQRDWSGPYGYYSNDPWDDSDVGRGADFSYGPYGYNAYTYDPWGYYDDVYP